MSIHDERIPTEKINMSTLETNTRYENEIRSLKVELCDAKDRIQRMADADVNKNNQIRQLQAQLTEEDSQIINLKGNINQKNAQIKQLQDDLNIANMYAYQQDAIRNDDPKLKEGAVNLYEARFKEYQEEIDKRDATINQLRNQLSGHETARISCAESQFEKELSHDIRGIYDMLVKKNKSYGNSALDPVRVFSSASPIEQILVRIDDKLSRIKRGAEFQGEDTIRDLIGYFFLFLQAKRQAGSVNQNNKPDYWKEVRLKYDHVLLGHQVMTGKKIHADVNKETGELSNIQIGNDAVLYSRDNLLNKAAAVSPDSVKTAGISGNKSPQGFA